MTDSEFIGWVANRFVHVYGESENVDFVARLRRLSMRTKHRQTLIERIARLNPEAGTIGPGMLRQIVDHARTVEFSTEDR